MLIVLLALALLCAALVVPAAVDLVRSRRRASAHGARRRRRARERLAVADPGRERRAEQRARELLRSCVNEEEWAMYRDLGFIRVLGRANARAAAERPSPGAVAAEEAAGDASEQGEGDRSGEADAGGAPVPNAARRGFGAGNERPARRSPPEQAPSYAYLLYPHKPILAYEPQTSRLLSEYCVEFPDLSDAVTGSRLPDSDDVLAKWMALTGDEGRLLRDANMHLPGRQLDPGRVRRDLWRLGEWERRRRSADASSR